MADYNLKTKIKIRHDSAQNWTAANPVLLEGEIGIEVAATAAKNRIKIGDGVKTWNELEYSFDFASLEQGGQVYTLTKDSLSTADTALLETIKNPKNGDLAVIKTVVGDVEYEMSSYIYDNKTTHSWIAITGFVDANKVIMRENITLAGNYTAVGNITKSQTGTGTLSSKGKSVAEVLTEIFSKRLQPTITSNPSVSGFTLSGSGPKEAGTRFSSLSFGTANLSAGSYTYGPATGITAKAWSIDRITTPSSLNQSGLVAANKGTDNNGGNGFIIGDQGGENVVSSISYKATATYDAGTVAKDNLGGVSNPEIKIPAGTKFQTTGTMTPYRNYFYGAVSTASPAQGTGINSTLVRGLTKSNKAYAAATITVNVPAGSTAVYIACISGKVGVTKVINETALNANVTDTFVKQTGIKVEGAEGYTAVDYNVWHFVPAVPYGNAAVLKVTLG